MRLTLRPALPTLTGAAFGHVHPEDNLMSEACLCLERQAQKRWQKLQRARPSVPAEQKKRNRELLKEWKCPMPLYRSSNG